MGTGARMEQTVLRELAALQRMGLETLRGRWRAFFGTEPPASYAKAKLVRRLAWRIQELRHGGLSDAARQRLREIADGDELACGRRRKVKGRKTAVAPGTRLIRHWHGVEHVVTATADGGFEWNGRRYRTLSAAAKAITGQHCSGPRFFGLLQAGGRRLETGGAAK